MKITLATSVPEDNEFRRFRFSMDAVWKAEAGEARTVLEDTNVRAILQVAERMLRDHPGSKEDKVCEIDFKLWELVRAKETREDFSWQILEFHFDKVLPDLAKVIVSDVPLQ